MDLILGWEWPGQQTRQEQDTDQGNRYPVPNPTDTEQQYSNPQQRPAPQIQPRRTIPNPKQTKPYAQPNNIQQYVAPPRISLVEDPSRHGTTSQQQQQQNAATTPTTKPTHVILSDSTMSRFRLPQFNNNTV
ncbi:unnamed protein product, partial [Didymodactylos carnosus]